LYMQRKPVWQTYLFLAVPSAGFLVIFLLTATHNFLLATGSYSIGPGAILVVGKTLHRLLWPWFYIFLILTWVTTRRTVSLSRLCWFLFGVIVMMLPYMFIAYQNSLQSRQLYLASAVLATLFAWLLRPLYPRPVLSIAVFAFVVFNVGYLSIRKDAQFEERAAPTTQLVNVLRQHSPRKTVITNFPYPYPEIATASALAVPGWAGLVLVGEPGANCTDCLQLQWNTKERTYEFFQHR
jgi:hypothetical protein